MLRSPAFTALLLSALIVLTSLGAGHARGAAQIAGQHVICTGQGIVTVSVDADGVPVERVVACPDCVLHLFAEGPPPPDAARPSRAPGTATTRHAARHRPVLREGRPPARAPPRAA